MCTTVYTMILGWVSGHPLGGTGRARGFCRDRSRPAIGDQPRELSLLFWAALRGSARRPFYWKEFFDQSRFILTANFIPLLLTGIGWGIIVSLEAGHFFKAASAEYRLGGFTVMANIREFSPVATGLMIAAVSGTAIVADLGARQVRQELEALSVMGLSNVLFIVVPRALALMVMTALYNVPMMLFTTLSGFFIAVAVVGVNPGAFLASFFTQGTLVDLFGGEIKWTGSQPISVGRSWTRRRGWRCRSSA